MSTTPYYFSSTIWSHKKGTVNKLTLLNIGVYYKPSVNWWTLWFRRLIQNIKPQVSLHLSRLTKRSGWAVGLTISLLSLKMWRYHHKWHTDRKLSRFDFHIFHHISWQQLTTFFYFGTDNPVKILKWRTDVDTFFKGWNSQKKHKKSMLFSATPV